MQTSDFNYTLPDELIADRPPEVRGTTRLLVLGRDGNVEDRRYADMVDYVDAGDVVVLNNTKVIPARMEVKKKSNGVTRELILLERHGDDEGDSWHQHKVLYRRSTSVGDVLVAPDGTELNVVEVIGGGIAVVSSEADMLQLFNKNGSVPLPPYMNRAADESDTERYQTVWAKIMGSVAAPTASLNMTEEIIEKLRQKGVHVVYATLHVGLGTFLPIRTEKLDEHVMHKEYFEIPASTLRAIRSAKSDGKKIFTVGTTMTRTLEYAADDILSSEKTELAGEADIFMYPGYEFKMVDAMITNFHAPKSTVLMLAAAFAGWDHLSNAYEHAIKERYSFLSYGDSMLLL